MNIQKLMLCLVISSVILQPVGLQGMEDNDQKNSMFQPRNNWIQEGKKQTLGFVIGGAIATGGI